MFVYAYTAIRVCISVAPDGFEPDASNVGGWPIAVTIPLDKKHHNIGWNVSEALSGDSKIKWVASVNKDSDEHHLIVDCDTWWYGESLSGRPDDASIAKEIPTHFGIS